MKLAIFDFDGTITTKDSFIEFIYYAVGPARFLLGFTYLAPVLILYFLKVLPNWKAKEISLTYFFNNWPVDQFQKIADDYSKNKISSIVKKSALEKIQWHKAQGHTVVVVSASPENYLSSWCQTYDIALIATRLESKDGKLTGKLATANCYGQEKIKRLKERYRLEDFEFIYAYGDSTGDKALKDIAQEFHFRTFH